MVKIFKILKIKENYRRFSLKKNNEKMGGRGRVKLWKAPETKESGKNLRLGAWGREMELRK
jgi:hypothetical protein